MNTVVKWAAAAWMMAAGVAQADNYVVVELFTSQGCSSCPPADSLLGELAARDDVIALAWHVDYWDYLGWKDEFANPNYTLRQRAYARAKRERTIYTPQMVVGGLDHAIGSRPMKVADLIRKHSEVSQPVDVGLKRNGDRVEITATAKRAVPNAVVQVVTFIPKAEVQVKRGENAGRKLKYHNVVSALVTVGTWSGEREYSTSVSVAEDAPVAVLVQAEGAGPILGAMLLR